ncbi:hypothetical protein HZX00_002839 [Salmonella enterica]|nr:hypothetical protein [Salmonella enterica]
MYILKPKTKNQKPKTRLAIIAAMFICGTAVAEPTFTNTQMVPLTATARMPSGNYIVNYTENANLEASGENQDIGYIEITRNGTKAPGEFLCFSSGTGQNRLQFVSTDDPNLVMYGDLWNDGVYGGAMHHKMDLNSDPSAAVCEQWLSYNGKYTIGGLTPPPAAGHYTSVLYLLSYTS